LFSMVMRVPGTTVSERAYSMAGVTCSESHLADWGLGIGDWGLGIGAVALVAYEFLRTIRLL
jgi:hypothetical protein